MAFLIFHISGALLSLQSKDLDKIKIFSWSSEISHIFLGAKRPK